MSSCCCCQGPTWCAKFCCPGLNKDKKLPHAGIQYSSIPSLNHESGDPDRSISVPPAPSPAKIKHAFVQARSQDLVGLPPQTGWPPGSESAITKQPVAGPGMYFRCIDTLSPDYVSSRDLHLRKQPANSMIDTRNDAIIQFSLHYDVAHSKLRVDLQHVLNLPPEHDRNGRLARCDPFVTLRLEPDRGDTLQSKVVKSTYNPEFNESFLFGGFSNDDIRHQSLVLRIYNGALKSKAVCIGEASLPLAEVDLFGISIVVQMLVNTEEIKSNRNSHGDLLISLSYSPMSRKLKGIIHKATGLKKHDWFGTADPFVRVKIAFKNKTMFKWKSSVKHNSLTPIYNERFSYEVPEDMRMTMDIENVVISFAIFDHDRLMPNDKMGYITIGKHAGSKLGRQHWAEVLKSPQQQISFWHPIQLATEAQKCQMLSRCSSPVPQ